MPQSVSASSKRLTLVATILGSSIAILDGSVVSVALPSIERSLGGGLAGQQWVSNAYLLTLGSLILLGGRWGTSSESGGCSRSGWPASAPRRCCARLRRRLACWSHFAHSRGSPALCSR